VERVPAPLLYHEVQPGASAVAMHTQLHCVAGTAAAAAAAGTAAAAAVAT
jgi:hypothetical protein